MNKTQNDQAKIRNRAKRKPQRRSREPKWDKLDNTAHLFPVIAGDDMSTASALC